MAKAVHVVLLELKKYIADWNSKLDRVVDKWEQQLKNLNDQIIGRIKVRLGDGNNIDPNQYINELANPATEGWKAFVNVPSNNNPAAVLGAFKHELRVKGGVYKYIDNVQAAFQIDPNTNKSYFQARVEAAKQSGAVKRIYAALQVVGARYAENKYIPAVIMAMTGMGRDKYLLAHDMVTGDNVVATKTVSANNQLSDFLNLLPAFEPHHSPYLRPYLISAIVQRFHLSVAANNLRDLGVITPTDYENYLKTINTPFKDIVSFKASSVNDVAIAYIDPLDNTYGFSGQITDRKNKSAVAFCVATGTDTCDDIKAYWP